MTLRDIRGVPVSAASPASLARFEAAAAATVRMHDPMPALQQALDEDPDLAIAHCLRAGLGIMSTEKANLPMVAESVAALERLEARLNDRELGHLAAARTWLTGDFEGAIRRYGDVLHRYPRDLLALQIAHVGDFMLGASQLLRDRVAQVMPAWGPQVPGFGYVLGMYAFGLEQTMLFSRAEDAGLRALELDPGDAWAVHAVAHVLETQGRLQEGIEMLGSRQADWTPAAGLAFHNWWHLALFHLDLGEHGRVLEIYDRHIRPRPSQVAYENVDASAMLWRLRLRGVDVGQRWQDVADGWEPAAEDGYYAFNDVHAVMSFLGAGREAALERTLTALEKRLESGGTNRMMTRDVGLPLARALVELERGELDSAIERLLSVRTIAHRFGGSHAQRDVINLTLLEAALRAGRAPLARALCAERTELKPQSPFNWQMTSRALSLAGDQPGAARASEDGDLRRKIQRGRARPQGTVDTAVPATPLNDR